MLSNPSPSQLRVRWFWLPLCVIAECCIAVGKFVVVGAVRG